MVKIIVVDKGGGIKELSIKNFTINDLYKKCGFRKNKGFEKQTTWNFQMNSEPVKIELWARTNGKANTENKYEFPPPIDSSLFFGKCGLVRYDEDGDIVDLSKELWLKVYEKLFGGFEDLTLLEEDDEEEEDELDSVPNEFKTKNGYLKDGFVIDTNSDDDKNDENEDENEDDDEEKNFDGESEKDGDSENEENEESDKEFKFETDEDADDSDFNEDSGGELTEEEYKYSDEDT